ncbi:hypothetical protein RQP46_004862 [Phenoliferia psychrophenolica]
MVHSGERLTEVPASIGDLANLVSLPRSPLSRRAPIQKTQSGPLNSFTRRDSSRLFSRTSSEGVLPARPAGSVSVRLFLYKNLITTESLSHALFSVASITTLSLRQNELDRLPPAVCRLQNLEELNLATNQISYLPAEILLLPNLLRLFHQPNPLLAPPSHSSPLPPSGRVLGPLITHFRIPSLVELTHRYLLAFDPDSPSATTPTRRIKGWEIPSTLATHLLAPFLTTLGMPKSDGVRGQPFDPLANVCRSPAHAGEEKCYVNHAVERMEWVSLAELTRGTGGTKLIPILHRGCGAACLDWLDEAQEEEPGEELDGFDV